mmetsp:Transcript_8004/g.18604  ORF Transcript_8004/g.18604 Transcript_8004/m.18604 type:complete len:229 (+) Transcript_8004:214-900(+)
MPKLSKKGSKNLKTSTADSETPKKRDSLRSLSKSLSMPKISAPRLSAPKLSMPKLTKRSSEKSSKSEASKKKRATTPCRVQYGKSESVNYKQEFAPGRVKEISSKKNEKRAGARRKLSKPKLSMPKVSFAKLPVRAKGATAPGRIQDGKADPVKEASEFSPGRIREKRRAIGKFTKPKISLPKLSLRKKRATDGKSKPVEEKREKKRVVKKFSMRKVSFKLSKKATAP